MLFTCDLLGMPHWFIVTNAIAAEESFETFHAPILEQVMPKRQLSQLRTEKHVTVHCEGESLAIYLRSIRDAALVIATNAIVAEESFEIFDAPILEQVMPKR